MYVSKALSTSRRLVTGGNDSEPRSGDEQPEALDGGGGGDGLVCGRGITAVRGGGNVRDAVEFVLLSAAVIKHHDINRSSVYSAIYRQSTPHYSTTTATDLQLDNLNHQMTQQPYKLPFIVLKSAAHSYRGGGHYTTTVTAVADAFGWSYCPRFSQALYVRPGSLIGFPHKNV